MSGIKPGQSKTPRIKIIKLSINHYKIKGIHRTRFELKIKQPAIRRCKHPNEREQGHKKRKGTKVICDLVPFPTRFYRG